MRWQKQGYNECQLATIAILADVPLREVRRFALSLGRHKTWGNLAKQPEIFWERALMVAAFFEISENIFPVGIGETKISTTASWSMRPILGGRGQIHLFNNDQGHAVAYQNGWIFDSNIPGRTTWKQLTRRYPWAHRFVITREDGKEVQWRKA